MNIETLLPLILKGGNSDMLKIVTALKCGDKSKAIESIMPKNEKTEQLVSLMKMAEKKPSVTGFSAIESFASNEILGMLTKFYT